MLRRNIKISFPIRFTYRTIYVLFTTFIAITLVRCLHLGLALQPPGHGHGAGCSVAASAFHRLQRCGTRVCDSLALDLAFGPLFPVHVQPFFGDLLGFIGAIATGPTTFWLPPLMWIILYRPVLTDVSPFAPCCSAHHIL